MNPAPVKLLYIAGFERSGSTILQNVLGQIPGFTAVGEVRYLWANLGDAGTLCGCGAPVRECPFWNGILVKSFGSVGAVPVRTIREQAERKTRDLIPMLTGRNGALRSRMKDYLRCLETLYSSIQEATRARVLLDSSKSPLYGYVLGLLQGFDVHVLHLTRDPRGIAHSLLRRKREGHPAYRSYGAVRGGLRWVVWNAAIEALWRRRADRLYRIRYEDFMASPENSLAGILDFVEEAGEVPGLKDASVALCATHTVGGSPSRFRTGEVALRTDETWKRDLHGRERVGVSLATFPLLGRYGYPFRAGTL